MGEEMIGTFNGIFLENFELMLHSDLLIREKVTSIIFNHIVEPLKHH